MVVKKMTVYKTGPGRVGREAGGRRFRERVYIGGKHLQALSGWPRNTKIEATVAMPGHGGKDQYPHPTVLKIHKVSRPKK